MSEKIEAEKSQSGAADAVKWAVALVLLTITVVGNQVYNEVPLFYRVLAIIITCSIAAFSAAYTAKGQAFLLMLKEARIETRKVVWPTKQETMQTTMVVLVVVVIMSLILWLLDFMLGKLISTLIG